MKKYEIPVVWESYKRYSVEAETLQEAVKKAAMQFLSEPDENYIQDSFTIDEIVSDEYPDEEFNFCEICQSL